MIRKLILKILEAIGGNVFYIGGNDVLPPPLSPEEEKKIIKEFTAGSLDARNILIEHNLRLVVYIARKFENAGVNVEDLISIGTIGLIKAVNTFKSDKNIKLATYASRCIENEILMCIRSTKKIKAEVSLNVPIGIDNDGNSISFDDILGTDPDDILNSLSLKIQVSQLLRSLDKVLTDREKQIVLMRYGIKGCEAKTQREIAAELGISRSYVSRIEKKALQKLKDYLKVSAI